MALRGRVRPGPRSWLTPIGPRLCPSTISTPAASGSEAAPFALSVPFAPRSVGAPRHPRRQYPIAPGSVGAPSQSVPPVGPPPGRLHRGERRAWLVSQLETTADRDPYGTNERTARTRRLERAGPLAAGMGPRPARTCHPRPAGLWQPPPASDSPGRTASTDHQPARSEPDLGPCLRLWGLRLQLAKTLR